MRLKMNNLVAKHSHKFNRPKVEKSKKDYSRKLKHKGKKINAAL